MSGRARFLSERSSTQTGALWQEAKREVSADCDEFANGFDPVIDCGHKLPEDLMPVLRRLGQVVQVCRSISGQLYRLAKETGCEDSLDVELFLAGLTDNGHISAELGAGVCSDFEFAHQLLMGEVIGQKEINVQLKLASRHLAALRVTRIKPPAAKPRLVISRPEAIARTVRRPPVELKVVASR